MLPGTVMVLHLNDNLWTVVVMNPIPKTMDHLKFLLQNEYFFS